MRRDTSGIFWDDVRQRLLIEQPKKRAHRSKDGTVKTKKGDSNYKKRKEKIFQVTRPATPDWRPPAELPTALLQGKWTISLDLETFDPELKRRGPGWPWPRRADAEEGKMVGISLASDIGQWYIPYDHPLGDVPAPDYDQAAILRYLGDLLANPQLSTVVFNRQYDEGWLRAYGIRMRGKVVDASTAAALLNEYRRSYSLDSLGSIYCDERKDEELLIQAGMFFANTRKPKSAMHKIPAEFVGPYAEQDAALTLKLWRTLLPLLREEKLEHVFARETALLPILNEMRSRGIRVDVPKAERLRDLFKEREESALTMIRQQTQIDLDEEGVWVKDPIVKVLESRGIKTPLDANGEPTIRKGWLESLPNDPVVSALLEARRMSKVRTTFLEGYILDLHVDGRVYGNFNPLPSDEGGAVSGRSSSTQPNLQNIPSRDPELGPLIRGLFLPEEGQRWGALDYSQQELRILVHFADMLAAPGAAETVAEYHRNPDLDFHNFAASITGVKRSYAKEINFALIYGMGGATLCHKLGLPTEWIVTKAGRRMEVPGPEGEAILRKYHQRLPFVKYTSDFMTRQAENRGSIRTLWGRKCRFVQKDKPETESYGYPFKALNRLVQGSAADQLKEATIHLAKEGIIPLVAVHDELGFSFESDAQVKRAMEIMTECLPLRVPSKVDAELGPSWGEAA